MFAVDHDCVTSLGTECWAGHTTVERARRERGLREISSAASRHSTQAKFVHSLGCTRGAPMVSVTPELGGVVNALHISSICFSMFRVVAFAETTRRAEIRTRIVDAVCKVEGNAARFGVMPVVSTGLFSDSHSVTHRPTDLVNRSAKFENSPLTVRTLTK